MTGRYHLQGSNGRRGAAAIPTAVLLALAIGGTAQTLRAQLPPLPHFRIETFGPEDGLPVTEVWELARGPSGRLYASTARGVLQFTGDGFRTLPSHVVDGDPFRDLIVDSNDRLWALTASGRITVFENEDVSLVTELDIEPWRIQEDSHGDIWVSGTRGLSWYHPETHRFERIPAVEGARVTGVFFDGTARVAVTGSGLYRIEGSPDGLAPVLTRVADPLVSDRLALAWTDSAGLWIHRGDPDTLALWRDGALHGFAPEQPARRILFRAGEQLQQVHRGFDGSTWRVYVDADGYSTVVRDGPRESEVVDLRSHADFRGVQSLVPDPEGNVWVGTDRGLIQLAPRPVGSLGREHGLRETFTTAVLQASDGAVWVATWGGGVHRFADGRLAGHWDRTDGLPDNRVRSLRETSDGTLWVGTALGIATIRDSTIARVWDGGHVRALVEDGDGRVWVGSDRGLFVVEGDSIRPSSATPLAAADVHALHRDADGFLWVGTATGLFRVAGRTVERFGTVHGLRDDWVVSIFEEGDGTLWFGTYAHGLHRYRGVRFVPVTTTEGLHHDGIWHMVDDDDGGVWFSSDGGLFRVDRARLHEVADAIGRGTRPDSVLRPLVFREVEGLPSRESNRASPAGARLSDGRMVFNNLRGVLVVDPRRALRTQEVRSIDLTAVQVDGLAVSPGDFSVAPAGTRMIAFEFGANAFVAPTQNRYAVRLDGFDEEWVDLGTRHRVEFTNLPPREFVLRVRARTGAGAWSEAETAWTFRIAPTLGQRASLRWFAGLALVGLLVAAHRVRVRHVLELEQTRLQIAADLHDEVGSNLVSIALLSEMLQDPAPRDTEARRTRLKRIHEAADATVEALREVIWLVDPTHHRLVELVDRMRETVTGLVPAAHLRVDAPEPLPDPHLRPETLRSVLLIFKEAMQNVAKHAGGASASVAIAIDGTHLTFEVVDDGPGFDPEDVRPGRGLDNMRRRAEEVDGVLTVGSRPGGGTTVRFAADLR